MVYLEDLVASMTVECKWEFLVWQLLDANGFNDVEITGGVYCPADNGDEEAVQFNIHTNMINAKELYGLYDKARELMVKLDEIRNSMIINLRCDIHDFISPYQKLLGISDKNGFDSKYDINNSINNLNDTLITFLICQMKENGLLNVKGD